MKRKSSPSMYAQNRRALTLTEMAIVLGVIGTVMGVVWTTTRLIYYNMEANTVQRQVTDIVTSFRNLYVTSDSFGTGVDFAADSNYWKFFPADMIHNGVIQTAFTNWTTGQGVSVGSNIGWGNCPHSAQQLQIVIWNIPYSEIETLINRFTGPNTPLVCAYSDCFGADTTPAATNLAIPLSCAKSALSFNMVFEFPKVP